MGVDRNWMLPAALCLAVQFFFVASLALAAGFNQPPPFVKYAETAACLVAFIAGCRAAWSLGTLPDKPTRYLASLDWSRHVGFAKAMVFVWMQFVLLTWAKAMLPVATSMWADVPLANFEAYLFGSDVWRLLPAAPWWLDMIYLAWAPTVGFAFAAHYFGERSNRPTVLLSLFLTIGILGTFGQYLLPSGGPIFFERLGLGDRFADMPFMWQSAHASDKLWMAYQGNYISFATGISAFPSIHVATSAWMAVSFRHWFAYLYFLTIFLGSVMIGWHYALDGIAGALGAVFCYALARAALNIRVTAAAMEAAE